MATALTYEEKMRRVRMALAEAGWPNANVRIALNAMRIDVDCSVHIGHPIDPTIEAVWTAFLVSKVRIACWPCTAARQDCSHDPHTQPKPDPALCRQVITRTNTHNEEQ